MEMVESLVYGLSQALFWASLQIDKSKWSGLVLILIQTKKQQQITAVKENNE